MEHSGDSVRDWTERILHQLGDPAVRSLDVVTAGKDGVPPRAPEAEVVVRLSGDFAVIVSLEAGMDEADAVVLLADQLQDGVLESTAGEPLPPCPGHGHPATARVVAGQPCWVCPQDEATVAAILPRS